MRQPHWQQDLVDRLVADAHPVRRLWQPEVRLLVWLGVALAAVVVPAIRVLRDDVVLQLREPAFLLEEGALLVGAALLGLAALRVAVPGRPVGRAPRVLAIAALAVVAALVLRKPVHLGWTMDTFIEIGRPCLWRSLTWAIVPWTMLVVAVRRGAPLAGWRVGALVGAAAWGLTLVAMRFCCQTEEMLHLSVFHVLPLIVGTVLTAALGSVLFDKSRAP